MDPKPRCIRTYHRIANKDYTCHRNFCDLPIFAGDPYWGEVWVCKKKLWIIRYHDHCPEDPDERERIRKEIGEDCVDKEENQIHNSAA